MNRKNAGSGGRGTPPTANPGETLLWTKADESEWSGGLQRFHDGDAGFDLSASRTVTVPPGDFARIPSNVKIAIPVGYWAMIVGRSSTFFNRQLLVQTAIIDNGWRGELWCVVKNMSDQNVVVHKGDRVAQVILYELVTPNIRQVGINDLPPGDRGEAGFGSTGGTNGE